MVLIEGQSASQGVIIGKILFYAGSSQDIAVGSNFDSDMEIDRFTAKRKEASDYFFTLAKKYRNEIGDAEADIFDAYAVFACDELFVSYVEDKIKNDKISAEYAVYLAGEFFAEKLSKTEDDVISSRESDVRDVALQILHKLRTDNDNTIENFLKKISDKADIILATDDISPSDMFQIKRSDVKGIVLKKGAVNSHASILARSMDIPVICGTGELLSEDFDDKLACLDGNAGRLLVNPDEKVLGEYTKLADEISIRKRLEKEMKGLKDETADGKMLRICCNISNPEEVMEVLNNDGHGIGLLRSEYLFLASNDYPSEEIQYEIYKNIAVKMKGGRVVVRTLDISDDKRIPFFPTKKSSESEFYGRTGNFRAFYEYPEILKSQLRAIYRASAFGNLAIMFPMITSVWEIAECKKICAEVVEELKAEHVICNEKTEIGAMIETPAAVMIADELAGYVDFFSVGTNDLTQYTLAVERNDYHNDRFYDNHHPAVLREIKMVADAAKRNGIRIGICGELASDETMLETFIAMGIDEISVNANSVLKLRSRIRSITASECNLDGLGC